MDHSRPSTRLHGCPRSGAERPQPRSAGAGRTDATPSVRPGRWRRPTARPNAPANHPDEATPPRMQNPLGDPSASSRSMNAPAARWPRREWCLHPPSHLHGGARHHVRANVLVGAPPAGVAAAGHSGGPVRCHRAEAASSRVGAGRRLSGRDAWTPPTRTPPPGRHAARLPAGAAIRVRPGQQPCRPARWVVQAPPGPRGGCASRVREPCSLAPGVLAPRADGPNA